MGALEVAAIGDSLNAGGALILTSPQPFLIFKGSLPAATVGSSVADHGSGSHNAATIVAGSAQLVLNGVPVAMTTAPASCGHSVLGTMHLWLEQ